MDLESFPSSLEQKPKLSILLSAETISRRVAELAGEIDRHYNGQDVLVVVVLKGAFVFAADLVRMLSTPVEIEFVRLESYGKATVSSRQVRLTSEIGRSIEGRRVLVVEDIIDTGWSLSFLLDYLEDHEAADIKVCALIDKPARREVDVKADFLGFVVPNVFVVGYGIDYDEGYRSLPDICVLEIDDLNNNSI